MSQPITHFSCENVLTVLINSEANSGAWAIKMIVYVTLPFTKQKSASLALSVSLVLYNGIIGYV